MSLYGESCINYSGVCKQYLPHALLNNVTFLSTLTHNEISEADVVNFMNTLKQHQNILSTKCDITETILPFLCQYVFPPCNSNNISSAQLISRVQCKNIRDVMCNTEWRLLPLVSSSSVLPNCESFVDSDFDIEYSNNSQADTTQHIQCHYQFKQFCGVCLPLCGKFSQYKVKTKLQTRAILIFSGASAFIGAILVFIAACTRTTL